MKKVFAMTLAVFMAFTLAACGQSSQSTASTTVATEPAATETAAETEVETETFELSNDVEFVCPFSAGGGSDLYARTAANIISELGLLGGRTITVDNRTGGGGAVGDAFTATKKPDGTTITTYVSAQITSPMVTGSGVTYSDLTPICNLAMDEYTIGVSSSAEYQTVDEFIEYAKANPGKITVGGSGSGTEDQVCVGLIELYCGIDLEYIAYDSSAEVMTAMLGGHINAGIYNPNEAISQYEAGECTLLAAFGPERISVLSDIPTFTELGYEDVQFQQFRGIFGPGGMDQETVDYWTNIFSQVVEQDDWTQGYLATNGLTSKFLIGDDFSTFIDGEAAKYKAVIEALGLLAS